MTPLPAAAATLAATIAAWEIARRAAVARDVTIGGLPPLVAAGAAGVAALAGARGGITLATIAVVAAVSVAAVVDARCGAIFDPLTQTLAICTFLAAPFGGTLGAALLGAVATGGALLALHALTQRRGIGLGDVKLAAGIGAGLGLGDGTIALGAAFALGGCYGVWLLATNRARCGARLRFGPFVAAGTYVAVVAPGLAR